ncbi:MAG: MFS transporter [Candidatus Hodarchaeota archaeon]
MLINRFLGTEELPVQAQNHMRLFLSLSMMIGFLTSLSSTFYILFVIDKIGFALAALTSSIMLLTQVVFDYPSGSFGDWIGQRWVLATAFIFYGIAFFQLAVAQSFLDFAIIGVINGLGNAQSSGTFETWLDNNYRKVVGDADPDRKIYGFTMTRIGSMNNLTLAASFLAGGTLATIFSRQSVFLLQFGLVLIVIVLILVFLKDIQTDEELDSFSESKSISGYFGFLKGGIKFLFSSKAIFLFLVGTSIYNVTWMIWGNLILFPIYFGYTGSDALASILRTLLFLIGIPFGLIMANVSKRFSSDSLPYFLFFQTILFFPSFIALTYLNPPINEFNWLGVICTFILLSVLVGTLFTIGTTLQQRIILDLVPSENRNAVYSLMPTIFAIFGIPVLPFAGTIVENFGLAGGIMTAGIVSLLGSLLISLGLHLRKTSFKLSIRRTMDSAEGIINPVYVE